MMKTKYRYSLWIQFIVILAILAGITIFSYTLTERQMATRIQDDTAQGLQRRQTDFLENVNQYETTSPIRSFIYNTEQKHLTVGYNSIESDAITSDFNTEQKEGIRSFTRGENTYYYLVSKYQDDHTYVFTFLLDNFYAQSYHLIERQVALHSMMILCGVIVLLMVWIITIIVPLRRIQKEIFSKDGVGFTKRRSDEVGVIRNTIHHYQHQIKQQQRNQEEFIHNISHDLKTPITVIRSYAEGIELGLLPGGSVESSAQVIAENADRLDDKVSQFLYLNRLDYLHANEARTWLNLNTVAKKVMDILQLQAKGITFEYEVHGQFELYGSEEQWRVFFENILSNSIRYAKTKIRVVIDYEQFYIENDGPLIENPDTIFEKFQKGTDGKSGLGLVIAKKTAIIHSCTLTVTQTPNVRFIVKKSM